MRTTIIPCLVFVCNYFTPQTSVPHFGNYSQEEINQKKSCFDKAVSSIPACADNFSPVDTTVKSLQAMMDCLFSTPVKMSKG